MLLKITSWLFLLYIVSLPLVQPFEFYLFGIQLQPSDVIFLAAGSAFAMCVLLGKLPLVRSRLYFWIAIYIAAFALSTAFSDSPLRSAAKLVGVCYLAAVAVVTVHLGRDKDFLRLMILAFVAGTILTVLAAIAGVTLYYAGFDTPQSNLLLFRFGSLPSGPFPRLQAFFANANMMCNFLNVGIFAIFVAASLNWIGNKLAWTLSLGAFFAAALTLSPGLGGIVLSFGLWFWVANAGSSSLRRRVAVMAGCVFAAIIFVAAASVSVDTPNTDRDLRIPFTKVILEPSVRALMWEQSLDAVLPHPVIGVGTGIDSVRFRYTVLSGEKQLLTDAHNLWLNVAEQAGIVGLIALMLLIRSLWSFTCFGTTGQHPETKIVLGLSCAFVGAFLYQGLTGSFEDARHLWVLFGLMAAANAGGTPKDSRSNWISTERQLV